MSKSKIEYRDNTRQFLDLFEKAKVRGLEKIGLAAEGYAKRGTPTDTGRLRNSITYAIAGKEAHVKSYSGKKRKGEKKAKKSYYSGVADGKLNSAVYIGTNVEYAKYIENGTTKIKPFHMLLNAATQHSDTYKRLFEKEFKNA